MSKNILVIEDDPIICSIYKNAVEKRNFPIEIANTGNDGLAKAEQNRPGLVFLDLHLPDIDGLEVLRKLNGLDPDIPVYIVTAFSEEYLKKLQNISKEGIAFELCKKPISVDKVHTILGNVLGTGESNVEVGHLKLYVAGKSSSAERAIANVKTIINRDFQGNIELEIIDILDSPETAEKHNIIATPALVAPTSHHNHMVIGDMSDHEKIMKFITLK